MRLIVVTTCTGRKKYPVPYDLVASRLPNGLQSAVTNAWRARVQSARQLRAATVIYSGRRFREAILAARAAHTDLRIISGGLGLIRADDQIPSYTLSLVPESSEYVGTRIVGESFDVARWWREIQPSSEGAPLADLLRANPTSIAVIGISKTYLSLISEDLMSLGDGDLDRLRLVGMGIESACPPRLQHCLLPYDKRLDGPDSPIRGTRIDFSSRAMRHFIETILPAHQGASIERHKHAVDRTLCDWRRPRSISRTSKTDDEIVGLIKKNWKKIEGKSSLGLRYLRDVKNIACEQGRFRDLFHRAAREVRS